MDLDTSVIDLNFIGQSYAKKLAKLEIYTLKDLLYHFPRRYLDRTKIKKISELSNDQEECTIQGIVLSSQNVFTKSGKKIQKARISDDTGEVEAVWFNQPYIPTSLKSGAKISLSGKLDFFGRLYNFISPEYEIIPPHKDYQDSLHTGRLVPIYPETAGVSSKWLRSRIFSFLKHAQEINDYLPEELKQKEKFWDLSEALIQIHFPNNYQNCDQARERLAFDELFKIQLNNQIQRLIWKNQKKSAKLVIPEADLIKFKSSLPFKLTLDQEQVIEEIKADLDRDRPMNRLVQGDVGSGKTIVAAMAIYAAYLNQKKSILMAPTEVLALQHQVTLEKVLSPLGLTIGIATGSKKSKLKEADCIVGTHALLFKEIPNLGLVVIDEQHKFGVKQRSDLLENKLSPHLLSMTATPIPRSIALTLYGNLDLSTIQTMPEGRKVIQTRVVEEENRLKAMEWIRGKIKQAQNQVFIVCPLIDDSESEALSQVKAVQSEYENLKQIFPEFTLDLLHGKLKPKEKDRVIERFRSHQSDILVTTPVIEVGIDIPNANIILIEGAERFGLASLHQLRGRVGRGESKSFCLLFTSQNSPATQRLQAMEDHFSGFKLAELDLKLRGPGDIYGLKQHGQFKLKVATLADSNLIHKAQTYALELLKNDPRLNNYPLLSQELNLNENIIQPN